METWLKNFVHSFWTDELAFKRWARGGLAAIAAVLTAVMADPLWATWSAKQWALKLLPAIVFFAAGSVTATRAQ